MMTRYWFKPKRYGYGATPVTWEGWAFTGLVVALIVGSGWLLLGTGRTPDWTMLLVWWAVVAVVLATSLVVSKSRTEGSWRWRWGRDS
jgi:hypothetical protein